MGLHSPLPLVLLVKAIARDLYCAGIAACNQPLLSSALHA